MAVFRIERTRDYTVMSNHHLRDKALSLKSKGLLSMMLSLPEDWNYTTRGLAKICKEGVDAIGGALRELEAAGYIVRHQMRDRQGRISDTEYVIYEQPQPKAPDTPQPDTASPDTENPYLDSPDTEKPAELNIEKSKTQKSNTQGASTDSIPFRETAAARPPERKGRDAMSVEEMQSYRDLVLENIEYDHLCREFATYREDLDEIVELIVETVCARRKTTRIAGADFPHEVVRSRFLKLDSSHIEFVMECLHNNTTEVRNMKQYLLTVLFNAPTTIRIYGDYPDEKAHAQVRASAEPEQQEPEHFIDHFYVAEDIQKRGALDIKEYSSFDDALRAYYALPDTQRKALGAMNTRDLPGSLDFVQCVDGKDTIIQDYAQVDGWQNKQTFVIYFCSTT